MMHIVRITLILLSLNIYQSSKAQGFLNLMAKPIDNLETQLLIEQAGENIQELFIPSFTRYELVDTNNGLILRFNSAMLLNQVELFAEGSRFQSFKGDLPLNLKWGMDSMSIIRTCGMIFSENPKNPYTIFTKKDGIVIQIYFQDKKLSLIRLTADEAKIENAILSDLLNVRYRLFPDGNVVEGNVIDGKGKMSWDNDFIVYDGEWSYGVPHGTGFYTDSFLVRYEGDFKLGYIWGRGLMIAPKGDIRLYEGEFVMGLRTGIGRGRFADGRLYEGKWHRNVPHGMGTLKYSNDITYKGMFDNGQAHGRGRLDRKDGYIEGTFHRGKPHGVCKQFLKSTGQTLVGNFVMGIKEGEFEYILGEEKQTIVFKNDKLVVD